WPTPVGYWLASNQRPPCKGRPAALAASPWGKARSGSGGSIHSPEALRGLAADLGQQLLFALALAQPAGVVLAGGRLAAQQVQRARGAVGGGVPGDLVDG